MKGKNPKNVVFWFFRCAAAAVLAARKALPSSGPSTFLNLDWRGKENLSFTNYIVKRPVSIICLLNNHFLAA